MAFGPHQTFYKDYQPTGRIRYKQKRLVVRRWFRRPSVRTYVGLFVEETYQRSYPQKLPCDAPTEPDQWQKLTRWREATMDDLVHPNLHWLTRDGYPENVMPENDEKFTMEELQQLFDDRMPIKVYELLYNAPDTQRIGELRAEVRKIAHHWRTEQPFACVPKEGSANVLFVKGYNKAKEFAETHSIIMSKECTLREEGGPDE